MLKFNDEYLDGHLKSNFGKYILSDLYTVEL